MAPKKKEYNNPALAFLNTKKEDEPATDQNQEPAVDQNETADKKEVAADPVPAERPGKPPKGYKINPMYLEVKSQRVQLALQPSVVKRLKKAAGKKKLSMNETANQAIIEYLEREGF